jgi:two-component system OmpR family response regulator/two-component system response regulator RstA
MQRNILIIEDDEDFAALLRRELSKQAYRISIETDGGRGLQRIVSEQPDLVILDATLPGKDGFEVCREARPRYRGFIVMLTGRDESMDRILGLELGADDYLLKPIDPRVVAAHVRACLRRVRHGSDAPEVLRYGTFEISRLTRTVRLGGAEVPFTTAEFDLLWLLAEHAGEVLSRDAIMNGVRRIPHDGLDRSIDMRVSRLRRRLGDDGEHPRRIKTVRGQGYLFSRTDWD